ncbi:hypothetical protein ID866_10131 [Astraeus odoratus]|nr:hypothetical protein ID866_10131 [Astraeus odoratus]
MAPPRLNPHEAAHPNFTSEAQAASRLALMGSRLTEEQAVTALTNLWLINNEQECAAWDRSLAEEYHAAEDARQAAAKAEERQRLQSLADRETVLADKRKKHKSKYMPVPNARVPLEPICLPACYALKQMESGGYVKLFYFTNQGIADAEEVATTPSDRTYIWKQQEDGCHSLVEASLAKRGLKSDPLPDEKLSWEQFFEATPCMVEFMSRCQWPQDCIDMFWKFWLGIQSHPWCTSSDLQAKQALLSYQAKQWKLWHYSIGMAFSFSLAEIEEEVLKQTWDELTHKALNTQLNRMCTLNDAMAASLPCSTSSAPHGSSLK